MLQVLAQRTYRHLFLAQVIALLGSGLATVALALLAYDLAGAQAGAVLGVALTLKMVAYIGVAPVAAALAERLPRRALLVSLDLVRAGVALLLPFVNQVWQVYVLILVLQSASAAFTPAFQAAIPEILPDEKDYTRALSLSRLAYDVESLVSPALAAALLGVMGYQALFYGTAMGFLGSGLLVLTVMLPRLAPPPRRPLHERTTRGLGIYLRTPRLRGLLALNLAIAAGGAMVIVNTVVLVQTGMGLEPRFTALALAAFGAGSMLVALVLPHGLERWSERQVMLAGALLTLLALLAGTVMADQLAPLLLLWLAVGAGYSLVQTPSGRLLRRSSNPEDRPALYAAHFALSHACWLLTYPVAGWLGAAVGMPAGFLTLAALAAAGMLLALRLWPAEDPEELLHGHADLPAEHPHRQQPATIGREALHSHAFVVDEQHRHWPSQGAARRSESQAGG